MKTKPINEVMIGDKAYECNCQEYEGKIIAIGTPKELQRYDQMGDINEYLNEGWIAPNDVLVAIEYDELKGLEQIKYAVFQYSVDPCSVFVPV